MDDAKLKDTMDNSLIESAWREYQALPAAKWRKDFFCCETGGYVATHVLKAKDRYQRPGIVAEERACKELAMTGKRILRLPDNVLKLIDVITVDGAKYRKLLKFKAGSMKPRGYPDAYFDGQTWDFKTSSYENEDSLRQTIKEGRKADNIVFIVDSLSVLKTINKVIHREIGMRKKDSSWMELPKVYCLCEGRLISVWIK